MNKIIKYNIYYTGGTNTDHIGDLEEEISETGGELRIASDVNLEVIMLLHENLNTRNSGNNNCGIIPYKNYIIKCVDGETKLINEQLYPFFPELFFWKDETFTKEFNGKYFYIMEKLEGDLSKYIIETSYQC